MSLLKPGKIGNLMGIQDTQLPVWREAVMGQFLICLPHSGEAWGFFACLPSPLSLPQRVLLQAVELLSGGVELPLRNAVRRYSCCMPSGPFCFSIILCNRDTGNSSHCWPCFYCLRAPIFILYLQSMHGFVQEAQHFLSLIIKSTLTFLQRRPLEFIIFLNPQRVEKGCSNLLNNLLLSP